MFNGKDEPQITEFFPNPYVTKDDEVTNAADWSRIEVWEELLPRYTGNAPDGLDRQKPRLRPLLAAILALLLTPSSARRRAAR